MSTATVPDAGSRTRVIVAVDSLKGSLDSRTAGEAVRDGILRASPDAQVTVVEIADGGEGTAAALLRARGGREVEAGSVDALGVPVDATYVVLEPADRPTAVVEAARTIGLDRLGLVDASTPLRASSLGLGRQLAQAVSDGHRRILVALGGTATTDGGTGLLMGLGVRLLDAEGVEIVPDGNALWHVDSLDASSLPSFTHVEITVMVDVDNPLLGARGAAAVFGPQKGATAAQVVDLELKMERWAAALSAVAGTDVASAPGSGAAGGCAAALLALGARLEPGFARVAQEVGLADQMHGADLVITGEGSLDAQTSMGKAPAGIARMARDAGAVVVAVAGRVDREAPDLAAAFDAMFCIHGEPMNAAAALDPGATKVGLTATAENVMRLFLSSRGVR